MFRQSLKDVSGHFGTDSLVSALRILQSLPSISVCNKISYSSPAVDGEIAERVGVHSQLLTNDVTKITYWSERK